MKESFIPLFSKSLVLCSASLLYFWPNGLILDSLALSHSVTQSLSPLNINQDQMKSVSSDIAQQLIEDLEIVLKGYSLYLVGAILLEAFIITSHFIMRKNSSIDPQLVVNQQQKGIDLSRDSRKRSKNLGSRLKTVVMYIVKLILRYSVCYLLCMIALTVISLICHACMHYQSPIEPESKEFQEGIPTLSPQNYSLDDKTLRINRRVLSPLTASIDQVFLSVDISPSDDKFSSSAIAFSPDSKLAYVFATCTLTNCRNYTLQILDVSNLASSKIIAEMSFTSPVPFISNPTSQAQAQISLSPDGNTLFMGSIYTLQVIDVSNPSSPTTVNSIFIGSQSLVYDSFALSSDGNTLFLSSSDFQDTLYCTTEVYNIANLSSFQLISTLRPPNNTDAYQTLYTYLNGELLYLINGNKYTIYNVSDIENPFNLINSSFNFGKSPSDLAALAFSPNFDILYITYTSADDTTTSWFVVNTTDMTAPVILTNFTSQDCVDLLFTFSDGRHVMAVTTSSYLVLYDAIFPESPIFLANVSFDLSISNVAAISPNSQIAAVMTTTSTTNQLFLVQLYFNVEAENALMTQLLPFNYFSDQKIFGSQPALSPDGNTIYVSNSSDNNILIFDVSNPYSISQVSTIDLQYPPENQVVSGIFLSSDGGTLYVATEPKSSARGTNISLMLCQTTSPQCATSIYFQNIIINAFLTSNDNTIAFLVDVYNHNNMNFVIMNISDVNQPNILSNITIGVFRGNYIPSLTLSADEQIVVVAADSLYFYNISDLSLPYLLGAANDSQVYTSILTSPDEQTLFCFTQDIFMNNFLNIYNISSLENPTLITSLSLPIDIGYSSPSRLTNKGMNQIAQIDHTLYIASKNLITIDVTKLMSPEIRSAQFSSTSEFGPYEGIMIAPGGNMAFINTRDSLLSVSLKPDYMIYCSSYDFPLGGSYPMNLNLLVKNNDSTYDARDFAYKFTQIALLNIEYTYPNQYTQTTLHALPSWMDFDEEGGVLILTPDSQSQIQHYHVFTTASIMFNNTAFINQVVGINNQSEANDLMMSLVSWGYLDNQGFLTSSFDPNQTMALSSQYLSNETTIRGILANSYISTVTQFSVSSSLFLTLGDTPSHPNITINTLSLLPVKINITLIPIDVNSQAQFVTVNYFLIPSFGVNQSSIALAGSLLDVNSALSQLIVYLGESEDCAGNITISDGLNPTLNQILPNISKYFTISSPPQLNSSYFLSQLQQVSPKTGQQFLIQFDPSTFEDPQRESLALALQMQDESAQVPDWLIVKGYTITGTPPDQLTGRDLDLVIVVSNQYQSTSLSFNLHISISWEYALRLIFSYLGGFVSAIGLLIYAPKIYNILFKKRYIYPKKFVIVAGKKITHKQICPFAFIEEELAQSKLILRHLESRVKKELEGKLTDDKIAYFYDLDTHQLNMDNLRQAIKLVSDEIRTKNVKQEELSIREEFVNQIITSELIFKRLDSGLDKHTKRAFEYIKRNLQGLVFLDECSEDGVCKFLVNRQKLYEALEGYKDIKPSTVGDPDVKIELKEPRRSFQNNPLREDILPTSLPLLEQKELNPSKSSLHANRQDKININLLIDAIEAYAFRLHCLNINTIDVDIAVFEKRQNISFPRRIRKFLKLDLYLICFSKRGQQIGYGLRYDIERGFLYFSGTVANNAQGKTIIVQIMNRKGWILKELELFGCNSELQLSEGGAINDSLLVESLSKNSKIHSKQYGR